MDLMATLAALDQFHWTYALAPLGGVAALITAFLFSRSVMAKPEGEPEMVTIAAAVREGAMAYLVRQYKVVAGVFVALIVVLFVLSFGLQLQPRLSLLGVPIAGILSGLCGWFGMKMATHASARTAFAAKQSLNDGLTVAFRSGAVMGMVVVGFALLDVSAWFFILNVFDLPGLNDIGTITTVMLSFAMGASTQALFARVGGGIYTKAADVGADLVGKVEAGIPEDDARNPATIADNVGDNVGDVAGMGADLYESYYGSILSTLALGAAAAFSMMTMLHLTEAQANAIAFRLAMAPLALAGLGIFCSIIGVFVVRAKEGASFAQLLNSLHMGVWAASAMIAVLALALLYMLFNDVEQVRWLGLWGSILSGLAAGLIIAKATEYYTSYEHPPTRRIAIQALTGPATVIIGGIAEGMRSTWAALLTIVVAILAAFIFAGGNDNFLLGLYGVALAAVGMLSTLGITLATDAYGPIADNAGGNAEMSSQPPHVRQRTDMLDSLGNTTAATGKGFAIGSAALTALALFAAYIQIVQSQLVSQGVNYGRQFSYVVGQQPTEPHAIYMGYGKFSLVIPGGAADGGTYHDGAILVDPGQLDNPREMEHVQPGTIFRLSLTPAEHERGIQRETPENLVRARDLQVRHQYQHGDHSHDFDFSITPTARANVSDVLRYYDVTLTNPRVLGGLFLGVLLTFLFCAMTMSAVGRAAYSMMRECRRQFAKMREAFRAQGMSPDQIADPEQWPKRVEWEGVKYPDYANCVSISTAGAQREMVIPSLLAITVPIGIGLLLSVPGVVGMLAGGLTCGFAVAVFMANAGGAWDNAKKLIESYGRITADAFVTDPKVRDTVPAELHEALHARAEEMRRVGKGSAFVYGKGSDDHKAAVVGDTVGDPFKDTSGPSLNILIKLISIVSVVFAGLTVKYGPVLGALVGLN